MKKGLTELVYILDKSGSMGGLESDTINGYNSMLKKQQTVEGECRITTVLFSNQYELLHDRIDIRAVRPITEKEYSVGGSTSLLDAVGRTLRKIHSVQEHTAEEYRSEKVLFIIMTDGEENSSIEYSAEQIKANIEQYKKTLGWEFIFLGANIDAVQTAGNFGIDADRAQNFHADSEGVGLNFSVMSDAAAKYRSGNGMPKDWNKKISKNYSQRSSRR